MHVSSKGSLMRKTAGVPGKSDPHTLSHTITVDHGDRTRVAGVKSECIVHCDTSTLCNSTPSSHSPKSLIFRWFKYTFPFFKTINREKITNCLSVFWHSIMYVHVTIIVATMHNHIRYPIYIQYTWGYLVYSEYYNFNTLPGV